MSGTPTQQLREAVEHVKECGDKEITFAGKRQKVVDAVFSLQQAALTRLHSLKDLSSREQKEAVSAQLVQWGRAVSVRRVSAFLKAEKDRDVAMNRCFVSYLDLNHASPEEALQLMIHECQDFLKKVDQPGGKEIYVHRREVMEAFKTFFGSNFVSTEPMEEQNIPYHIQLRALTPACVVAILAETIEKWSKTYHIYQRVQAYNSPQLAGRRAQGITVQQTPFNPALFSTICRSLERARDEGSAALVTAVKDYPELFVPPGPANRSSANTLAHRSTSHRFLATARWM